MAMLWTICGAGKGVGKTHLALGICGVLPDAVYVKLGCGRFRPDGPRTLVRTEEQLGTFIEQHSNCRHIVAEANTLAERGEGDVIIFIDGRSDHQDREELRRKSHIAITHRADIRNWKRVLRDRLGDADLAEKVLRLIVDQHRFLCGSEIRVRSRIWLEAGAQRVLGPGLAGLLDGIGRLGSLRCAARAAKMSYRRAWELIKDAENALGRPLVIPHAGGAGGGGSTLSDEGRRLLDTFNTLSREVADFADQRFALLYGRDIDEPV